MTVSQSSPRRGVAYALGAAALFGASTPFAKLLLGDVPPVLLAGLLYLGSGCGLTIWGLVAWLVARSRGVARREASLKRKDAPWLAGAVFFGGVLGPVCLMLGLAATAASTASLLLNLEGVFTALLAWYAFRENFDRRVALGMAAIVAGGVVLSWAGMPEPGIPWGALAVAVACLCWAVDNNLTRKVSAADPLQTAAIKGLVAGPVNVAVGLAVGGGLPGMLPLLGAGVVGFLGYGVSLTLFVLALRHLGTARTGAYFSVAPFIGAAVSLILFRELPGLAFMAAAVLMGVGVSLHLTEKHEHEHVHEEMEHDHLHVHDAHHQHEHLPTDPPGEPHSHPHRHAPLRHTHAHYPDIHHRHRH